MVELAGKAALLGNQPAAMCRQCAQSAAGGVRCIGLEAVMRGGQILGDHGRIDRIGLGCLSQGTGKAADPRGGQDIHLHPGRLQAVGEPALIAARGFQSDSDRRQGGHLPGQCRNIPGRTAAAEASTAGVDISVEPQLGRIYAN